MARPRRLVGYKACAVLVTALVAYAAQQSIGGQPVQSRPPLESFDQLDDFGDCFQIPSVHSGPVSAAVTVDPLGRKIISEWSWGASLALPVPKAATTVEHAVSFWPTAARYIGDDKIVVVGKSMVHGRMVIEIWRFARPTIATIGTEHFMRAGNVSSKVLAYTDPESTGMGLARAVWHNRALGGENIVVLTLENKELYNLDLAAAEATLVASASQQVGDTPALPDLLPHWAGYNGPRRHLQHGDLYFLTNQSNSSPWDGPEVHSLCLVDGDLDGQVEGFMLLSQQSEQALGFNDPNSWD